jgi:regulator of protease activity HflC (stomatin/prohibitin superfamily)
VQGRSRCVGVLFIDGRYIDQLSPGLYAFWKDAAESRAVELDLRETQIDVSGQEIMTADKVTLRMNAIVTYDQDAFAARERRAMLASHCTAKRSWRCVQWSRV